jgi:branched-chain amino acid aminotransferase
MTVNINWDDLSFSLTPTAYMYVENTIEGEWLGEGAFRPFGDISISPAAGVLNYGQGLFEGLKAYKNEEGKVALFRHRENIKRLNNGAKRLSMPAYSEKKFMRVIEELVKKNHEYIPPYGKGELYIRPTLWGTTPLLGVAPAKDYGFVVFASPVGPYFKTGFKPIKLKITTDYHRAAPKGTGSIKYIGNYASGMLPAKEAKANGLNEVIYLDAVEDKYIEEVGAANFFMVKGNTLFTPKKGSILPGITRDSIMKIAKDILKMKVVEKRVSYEEVLDADECFASGTAAVIASIGSIEYKDITKTYHNMEVGPIASQLYKILREFQHLQREDVYGWSKEIKLS